MVWQRHDPESASNAWRNRGNYEQLLEARRKDSQAQLWPEAAVRRIGEDYQRVGDIKNAIETFKLNVLVIRILPTPT